MPQQPFFMAQPFPGTVRQLFLDSGACFDFSMEDRRKCGHALERHFVDRAGNQAPHPWFMPIIFGGVTFNQAPPWAVMMAMGIYGYLAEGGPAPLTFRANTLAMGYHALRIPAEEPFFLLKGRTRLPLTDAFLRIDDKVDPAIWIDLYGLAPLLPGVRVAPFTLIPSGDPSGCVAGAVLVNVAHRTFLNPLKEHFQASDVRLFFTENPSPTRLRAHRERLFDILGLPIDELATNLDVAIALIQKAFIFPGLEHGNELAGTSTKA